jgi:hypothetical protein
VEIRIKVPRMPSGLLPNLIGLIGLIAVALAAGGLTGNYWWSVLVGGVFAIGVAYVVSTQNEEATAPAPVRAIENGHSSSLAAEIAKDAAFMRGQAV